MIESLIVGNHAHRLDLSYASSQRGYMWNYNTVKCEVLQSYPVLFQIVQQRDNEFGLLTSAQHPHNRIFTVELSKRMRLDQRGR